MITRLRCHRILLINTVMVKEEDLNVRLVNFGFRNRFKMLRRIELVYSIRKVTGLIYNFFFKLRKRHFDWTKTSQTDRGLIRKALSHSIDIQPLEVFPGNYFNKRALHLSTGSHSKVFNSQNLFRVIKDPNILRLHDTQLVSLPETIHSKVHPWSLKEPPENSFPTHQSWKLDRMVSVHWNENLLAADFMCSKFADFEDWFGRSVREK